MEHLQLLEQKQKIVAKKVRKTENQRNKLVTLNVIQLS